MKKLFVFLVLMAITFSLYGAATGETKNASTITFEEMPWQGVDWCRYVGVTNTTVAADSIGIHYTEAMLIAPFAESTVRYNGTTSYCLVFLDAYDATATEDVNVNVEFSNDLTTWVDGGKVKDQLTPTAVIDTINVITGTTSAQFQMYKYMRLKFDYQAGNSIGTYGIFWIVLHKPDVPDFKKKVGQVVNTLD